LHIIDVAGAAEFFVSLLGAVICPAGLSEEIRDRDEYSESKR